MDYLQFLFEIVLFLNESKKIKETLLIFFYSIVDHFVNF